MHKESHFLEGTREISFKEGKQGATNTFNRQQANQAQHAYCKLEEDKWPHHK